MNVEDVNRELKEIRLEAMGKINMERNRLIKEQKALNKMYEKTFEYIDLETKRVDKLFKDIKEELKNFKKESKKRLS